MSGPKTTGRMPAPPRPAGQAGPQVFDAPLSCEAIEQALGLSAAVRVEVVEQTGSTSDDLLERARLAAPERPTVRVALHQVAGRGRHGRRWQAARCSFR
jgi:hypothetical protein